jgi:hypothetical protein
VVIYLGCPFNKITDYFASMIKLHFPEPDFNTRKVGEVIQVFDRIRKLWVVLQPEEWVRQNLVNWFTLVQKIPRSFISIEQSLNVNSMARRCDLLIYDRDHQPWMMVEVKAQGVELNSSVITQILNYNIGIPVKYIMITNGDQCFIADIRKTSSHWVEQFPEFQ